VQRYALLAANEARGKDPKACAAAMLARLVINPLWHYNLRAWTEFSFLGQAGRLK